MEQTCVRSLFTSSSPPTLCLQVIKEAIKDSIVYRKENPSRCNVSLSLNEIHNKKFLKREPGPRPKK